MWHNQCGWMEYEIKSSDTSTSNFSIHSPSIANILYITLSSKRGTVRISVFSFRAVYIILVLRRHEALKIPHILENMKTKGSWLTF